jgi:hypothetical protein
MHEIKPTETREITPYVWVQPDEERGAPRGGSIHDTQRCCSMAVEALELTRLKPSPDSDR